LISDLLKFPKIVTGWTKNVSFLDSLDILRHSKVIGKESDKEITPIVLDGYIIL
jgi:hypothetical protein